MVRIDVDAETDRKIAQSLESFVLFDNWGQQIGFFERPITRDEVAEARRRAGEPGNGFSLDDFWNRMKGVSDL